MRINFHYQGFLHYQKLVPDAKIDIPAYKNDVGYDVHSIEEKVIKAKSSTEIRTGLAFEIPEDYFALIRTRSGYGVKNSLQCHHGTIDPNFRGEVTVRIYNHGDQDYKVSKGDKICQLVLYPRIVIPLKEEKVLTPSERGTRGYGSTGK
jgi:dUTP pyrophosphatase